MEILLTVLVWLWQIGWILVLGGLLCALAAVCIKPLRKRKAVTFAACAAVVCLLLTALCLQPIVAGDDGDEKEIARQLAAGRYSEHLPFTPVCAVVDKETVRVWYAFAGQMTYRVGEDGFSIVEPLFGWN